MESEYFGRGARHDGQNNLSLKTSSSFAYAEAVGCNQERPFFFIAGLWDIDPGEGGARSFTMVTTEPNDLVRTYHDRMPVVLAEDAAEAWLTDPDILSSVAVFLLEALLETSRLDGSRALLSTFKTDSHIWRVSISLELGSVRVR
jgi:hypothetical protein